LGWRGTASQVSKMQENRAYIIGLDGHIIKAIGASLRE
jgi:hypothetical protein